MAQYNPGPQGGNSDNLEKDPRGTDAPQQRLGADARQLNGQD